jgi:hypothetical protein
MVPDGYYVKELVRNVLEELDEPMISSQHDSYDLAMQEIVKHKDKLKFKSLTILQIISVNYEGEIN